VDREQLTTDAELIARIRGGEIGAAGVLFKRHYPKALRYARWCAGETAAEDVVSDAFERTLDVIRRGAGPTEFFRAYLFTCIRNITGEQERRSHTRAAAEVDLSENYLFETFERDDELWSAFESLTDRWRQVLWYSEVLEMSLLEQAARWGLSSNAAAALGVRARKALRAAYLQGQVPQVALDSVCAPTRLRFAAYLQGTLSIKQRVAIQTHLARCVRCRRVSTALTSANPKLAQPATRAPRMHSPAAGDPSAD